MPGLIDKIGGLLKSPTFQGIAGAAAFGANPLVGLLAGPGIKADRESRELRNELLRSELGKRKRTSTAQDELSGLLQGTTSVSAPRTISLLDVEGGDPTQIDTSVRGLVPTASTPQGKRQMLGLLAELNPAAAVQSLTQSNDRADPAVIRTLEAIGIDPMSKEGRDLAISSLVKNNGTEDLIKQVQLQLTSLSLDQKRREISEESEDKTTKRKKLVSGLNSSLNDLVKLINLNNNLEGTFLQPGLPGSSVRRTAASISSEIAGLFGADTSGTQKNLDDLDKFSKLAANVGIDAIARLENFGTLTNDKLAILQDSIAGIGVNPSANRLIAADLIDEFLTLASIENIDVPNEKLFRSIANEAREQGSQRSSDSDLATGESGSGSDLQNLSLQELLRLNQGGG